MYRYIIVFFGLLLVVSCNNNSTKVENKSPQDIVNDLNERILEDENNYELYAERATEFSLKSCQD